MAIILHMEGTDENRADLAKKVATARVEIIDDYMTRKGFSKSLKKNMWGQIYKEMAGTQIVQK
jgi:hypothetical protein